MEDGTERETHLDLGALTLLVTALLRANPGALDEIEAGLEAYALGIGRADISGAPEAVEMLQRARWLVQGVRDQLRATASERGASGPRPR